MTTIMWNLLWVSITAIIFFIMGVMSVSVPRAYKLAKFINSRVNSRIYSRMMHKIECLLYMYMYMISELNAAIIGMKVTGRSDSETLSEEERKEISRLMELTVTALKECELIINELKESTDNKSNNKDTETILELEELYYRTAYLTNVTKYFVEKGDFNE